MLTRIYIVYYFNVLFPDNLVAKRSMKNHVVTGIVISGKMRGKDLGFPTANIALSEDIEEGIYISRTDAGSGWLPSVTFIGAAETFGEHDIKSETYVLDFNENLYGKTLAVELLKKIRGSEAFESVEKLIDRMNEDVRKTREYFQEASD